MQSNQTIQEQLRAREVKREIGENQETVTFDTGQSITRRRDVAKQFEHVRELKGIEAQDVIVTAIEDRRTGRNDVNGPAGGRSGYGTFETIGFPELGEFAGSLKQFRKSTLEAHPPAILSVPSILFTQPQALLQPRVLWEVFRHTVFPFDKIEKISFKKTEDHFERNGDLIDPSAITAEYDGWVACVGPGKYSRFGEKEGLHDTLEVLIFNPKLLAETAKAENPDPAIPNRQNSVFNILLGISPDLENRWPTAHLSTIQYAREKFNAVDTVSLETIEEYRHSGFYVKVSDELLDTLEKIAPLPIEASDCGKSLGFPELNDAFEKNRAEAWEMLKERSRKGQ